MNTKWSDLNNLQLGRYAEYYAKMVFSSYGWDIYTSEVDDHGVDFVAKDKDNAFFEIQVKGVRNNNVVCMSKEKQVLDKQHLIAYLRFTDDHFPEMYVIPSLVFLEPNQAFSSHDYVGKKSKPEWVINYTGKTKELIEAYRAEAFFS